MSDGMVRSILHGIRKVLPWPLWFLKEETDQAFDVVDEMTNPPDTRGLNEEAETYGYRITHPPNSSDD